MTALTELIEHRDALKLARLRGVRRVRNSSGEEIEYRSDSEIAAALASADREIAALTDGPHPKTILFRTSKGL